MVEDGFPEVCLRREGGSSKRCPTVESGESEVGPTPEGSLAERRLTVKGGHPEEPFLTEFCLSEDNVAVEDHFIETKMLVENRFLCINRIGLSPPEHASNSRVRDVYSVFDLLQIGEIQTPPNH